MSKFSDVARFDRGTHSLLNRLNRRMDLGTRLLLGQKSFV